MGKCDRYGHNYSCGGAAAADNDDDDEPIQDTFVYRLIPKTLVNKENQVVTPKYGFLLTSSITCFSICRHPILFTLTNPLGQVSATLLMIVIFDMIKLVLATTCTTSCRYI